MNKDEYFLKSVCRIFNRPFKITKACQRQESARLSQTPGHTATLCLLADTKPSDWIRALSTPSLSSPCLSSPNTVSQSVQSCSRRDSFTTLTETPLLKVSMQHVDEELNHLSHDTVQMLIQKSVAAKEHAYCVYSKFRVGAALLTADGCVYTGNRHVNFYACVFVFRGSNLCLIGPEVQMLKRFNQSFLRLLFYMNVYLCFQQQHCC